MGNGKLNAAGEKLATTMGSFWKSLAAVGRPGTEAQWPAYTNETDSNIIFDSTLSVESGRRAKFCSFWFQAFSTGYRLPDTMGALARAAAQSVNSVEFV